MKEKIMEILDLTLKEDGKSIYTTEDKCELINQLFNLELKETFNNGWHVGYERGTKDGKMPSTL